MKYRRCTIKDAHRSLKVQGGVSFNCFRGRSSRSPNSVPWRSCTLRFRSDKSPFWIIRCVLSSSRSRSHLSMQHFRVTGIPLLTAWPPASHLSSLHLPFLSSVPSAPSLVDQGASCSAPCGRQAGREGLLGPAQGQSLATEGCCADVLVVGGTWTG